MSLTDSETIAFTAAFLLIATIALILRINIRYGVLHNHGKEDILVIFAWV